MIGARKTAADRGRDMTERAKVFARRLEDDPELEASPTDRRETDSPSDALVAPAGEHVDGLVRR